MKKFIPMAVAGMLGLVCLPCLKAETLSLNEAWQTYLLESHTGAPTDTFTVDIPHNWDDYYGYRQLTHGNLHGSAFYSCHFSLTDKQWHDGRHGLLRFEGVGSYATVRLNGRDLGRYAGGRVCFFVDATEALRTGDNYLEVKVEHPEMISDLPCVCGGCSSEWGFSEGSQPLGIFRPLSLELTDEVRVEPFGVHVWSNDALDTLFVETEIRNQTSREQTVVLNSKAVGAEGETLLSFDGLGLRVPADTVVIVRQSVRLDKFRRWSPTDPYLYSLESVLNDSRGTQQYALSTRFGLRSISWPVKRQDGDGRFYINGEPYFINGTCEYEHLLGGGHAFSEAQIRARAKEILSAGFNAYRDAHQPHNLLYQQIWDENGVLFWTQLSAHIWYDTPEFRETFKAQMRQWVRERRNSPSVVLWGLQNESVLPESFARECCEIIREMDPTARTMRAITTCNGGVGTDWNVVQNWSGTYGGDLFLYDRELAGPSQLLNGEYGAWRTFGLHQEPAPFDAQGAYSEERFTQLLETKVRLAEQARDRVCGQFQWIFESHDNPGRRQPEEAYRAIDRVGPVNYKGLLTPWEEPVDAYYMYRSNYVEAEEDPMVYVVSHTWPDRFPTSASADVEVFSNCDSVVLFNDADGCRLGSQARPEGKGRHFVFQKVSIRYNVLKAVGYVGGKSCAEDLIVLSNLPESPEFKSLYVCSDGRRLTAKTDLLRPAKGYRYVCRLNCGGDDYTDAYGHLWQQDNLIWSHSWAQDFPSMNPYQASQRWTADPIANTRDWPLIGHFRYGRQRLSYRFPLPNGSYRLELYFVEPWYGTGGMKDASGLRRFDVAVNGETRLKDLDIWSEAGHDAGLRKTLDVEVTDGCLCVSFPKVEVSQALISAIAISCRDRKLSKEATAMLQENLFPVTKSLNAIEYAQNYVDDWSWEEADGICYGKLPSELLPEDIPARPSVNYPAVEAAREGQWRQIFERKKDAVMYMAAENGTQSITWEIATGLAQVYALRFNYRNLSTEDVPVKLRMTSADGRVLKESVLTFSPNDRGWKALSTTTGTYVNAGTYFIELSAPSMEGLQLESLDVQ